MSKVLQLATPTIRNQRTLIWLQQQSEDINWSRWSAVVTSLSDHTRWEDQGARVAGLILTEVDRDQDAFFEELFSISKYILMILLPQSILSLKSEEFWADNFDNVLNLDQILESYPFLMKPWDGTKADAVSIFALLCRYNRIVDGSEKGRTGLVFEQGMVPAETYLISQYFVHSNKTRAKEIQECLIRNCACPEVDHVILLNETDLSKEWATIPYREKIKQVIIKKRLTYSSFLKYVSTDVPLNSFVLLCNADIYMGTSLLDLWKIKLEDRMLALLRWDDPADGTEPVLFGPRADSQDCWVFRSDCIKNRTWDYSVFNFALGQAGCDNAFAGHILRNRFVLSNPALSFQTLHLHNSNIRNYSKKDYIRSDLYINLVPTYLIDTAQEQVPKTSYQSICNELVSFEVQSSSLSNEITYCTMVEKEGRYKWEPSVENHYFEPAIPVYSWKQACITPNGLVYDPYTITRKNTQMRSDLCIGSRQRLTFSRLFKNGPPSLPFRFPIQAYFIIGIPMSYSMCRAVHAYYLNILGQPVGFHPHLRRSFLPFNGAQSRRILLKGSILVKKRVVGRKPLWDLFLAHYPPNWAVKTFRCCEPCCHRGRRSLGVVPV